jgi:hypothetical protein
MRSQIRPFYLFAATLLSAMTLMVSTLGSQAQMPPRYNPHPKNWSDNHQNWNGRCASRADAQGRWGQQRQWDSWCRQNFRFRSVVPDGAWQRTNPWDHGRRTDYGPGH